MSTVFPTFHASVFGLLSLVSPRHRPVTRSCTGRHCPVGSPTKQPILLRQQIDVKIGPCIDVTSKKNPPANSLRRPRERWILSQSKPQDSLKLRHNRREIECSPEASRWVCFWILLWRPGFLDFLSADKKTRPTFGLLSVRERPKMILILYLGFLIFLDLWGP